MIELEPETITRTAPARRIGADFVGNLTRFKSTPATDFMAAQICAPKPEADLMAVENSTPISQAADFVGVRNHTPKPAADPDETPETLFGAAVQAINKRYQPGTLEHAEDHLPELAAQMKQAFDRLNWIWSGWIPGANLEPFKRSLRTWYDLTFTAIKEFEDFKNER